MKNNGLFAGIIFLILMQWNGLQAQEGGTFFVPGPALHNPHAWTNAVQQKSQPLKDAVWQEDFSGGLPGDWQAVNVSGFCGFTHTYEGPQGPFSVGVPPLWSATAHNGFMILDSDLCSAQGGEGITDAFLQSPPIDLSGQQHIMLSFQHAFRYCCSYENTQLLVQVSTDGQQWVSWDVKNGIWPNNMSPNPIYQYINISEVAAGQEQVWIRFRKTGASHYYWMIDDVAISTSLENDLELFSVNTGGYTMIPGGQQQPVAFQGRVRNMGAATQTGLELTATVNSFLYDQTSPVYHSLASGAEAVLGFQETFLPPAKGLYHIEFQLMQDQADGNPENNLFETRITITDSVYARDNGIYSGEGIWNGSEAFASGTLFEIIQPMQLTSLDVALHEFTQPGAAFTLTVLRRQAGGFVPVTSTAPYIVSQEDISTEAGMDVQWVSISLGSGLALDAGHSYLAAIHFAGDGIPLAVAAQRMEYPSQQVAYTQKDGVWQAEPLLPMIRMNFGMNESPCQLIIHQVVMDAYCGTANGEATVFPLTGFPPFTYEWSTQPVQTTATATGLSAGDYQLTVWDAQGCEQDFVVSVGNQELELETASVASACGAPNGQATVMPRAGFGPFSFQWDTNPTQTTQTATGLLPGIYSVTVTDSIGCIGTAEVEVGISEQLSVDYLLTRPVCQAANGSIELMPQGGSEPFTFAWQELPGHEGALAEGLAAGNYSITITDQSGCETTLNITLDASAGNLQLDAAIVQASCQENNGGISLEISGGNAPFRFLWSNGNTTAAVEDLSPGIYSVVVTDEFGCLVQEHFVIENSGIMPEVNSTLNHSPGCGESLGAIVLEAANPQAAYTFLWSGGQQTPVLENLPAGFYAATITEPDAGCQLNLSFMILDEDAPAISYDMTPASCYGYADGSIMVSMEGGSGDPVFSWEDGSEGAFISGLPAGNYTLSAVDGNCFTAATIQVSQPEPLGVVQQLGDVMCHGDTTGYVFLTAMGGTSPYSFYWTNHITGNHLQNVPAGHYTVMLTDFHNCTYQQSFTINQPAPMEVDADISYPEPGQNNGSIFLTVTGGTGAYSYTWSNGTVQSYITGAAAGSYTVIVRDGNHCSLIKAYNLGATGIAQGLLEDAIHFYPNPVGEVLNIDFRQELTQYEIALYDLSGRLIRRLGQGSTHSGEMLSISLSGIPSGVYMLNLTSEQGVYRKKLIRR
jgi:hypothetical protein